VSIGAGLHKQASKSDVGGGGATDLADAVKGIVERILHGLKRPKDHCANKGAEVRRPILREMVGCLISVAAPRVVILAHRAALCVFGKPHRSVSRLKRKERRENDRQQKHNQLGVATNAARCTVLAHHTHPLKRRHDCRVVVDQAGEERAIVAKDRGPNQVVVLREP
jgi:hypothetical protein